MKLYQKRKPLNNTFVLTGNINTLFGQELREKSLVKIIEANAEYTRLYLYNEDTTVTIAKENERYLKPTNIRKSIFTIEQIEFIKLHRSLEVKNICKLINKKFKANFTETQILNKINYIKGAGNENN